jgi:hypothetical protein
MVSVLSCDLHRVVLRQPARQRRQWLEIERAQAATAGKARSRFLFARLAADGPLGCWWGVTVQSTAEQGAPPPKLVEKHGMVCKAATRLYGEIHSQV